MTTAPPPSTTLHPPRTPTSTTPADPAPSAPTSPPSTSNPPSTPPNSKPPLPLPAPSSSSPAPAPARPASSPTASPYLVREQGVPPWRILAVTFTNKAAREMRDRVDALLGDATPSAGGSGITLGTFHAVCVRILRRDGQPVGVPRGFVIYDDDDQLTIVKRTLADLAVDTKHHPPRRILSAISRAKNEGLPVEAFKQHVGNYFQEIVARSYERYQAALQANAALDFDDLLGRTLELFTTQPDIAQRYQERFQHVLVDEFQDTNVVQYQLARAWAAGAGNLTVVGDPDQSIYSWRAADIRNILHFERDFPTATTVRLEQNYRSTKAICRVADAVIDKAAERIHKQLWTHNPEGDLPVVYEAYTETDEADYVAREIAQRVAAGDWRPGDVAVCYRTNAQSRVVEEAFLRRAIPYRLIGGTRFYARREVKDLLALCRLVHNPHDDVAFDRMVNVPGRGIGQKTRALLLDWADRHNTSLSQAARAAVQGASVRPERGVAEPAAVEGPSTSVHPEALPSLVEGPVEGPEPADQSVRPERVERVEGNERTSAVHPEALPSDAEAHGPTPPLPPAGGEDQGEGGGRPTPSHSPPPPSSPAEPALPVLSPPKGACRRRVRSPASPPAPAPPSPPSSPSSKTPANLPNTAPSSNSSTNSSRETGYQDYLYREFDDGEDRWNNVLELRTVAANYDALSPSSSAIRSEWTDAEGAPPAAQTVAPGDPQHDGSPTSEAANYDALAPSGELVRPERGAPPRAAVEGPEAVPSSVEGRSTSVRPERVERVEGDERTNAAVHPEAPADALATFLDPPAVPDSPEEAAALAAQRGGLTTEVAGDSPDSLPAQMPPDPPSPSPPSSATSPSSPTSTPWRTAHQPPSPSSPSTPPKASNSPPSSSSAWKTASSPTSDPSTTPPPWKKNAASATSAFTRAQRWLYCLYAFRRALMGQSGHNPPSRYLTDLLDAPGGDGHPPLIDRRGRAIDTHSADVRPARNRWLTWDQMDTAPADTRTVRPERSPSRGEPVPERGRGVEGRSRRAQSRGTNGRLIHSLPPRPRPPHPPFRSS